MRSVAMPSAIEGYGKGAIVGEAGELEHGALWHIPGGYAMRELLGNAKAIVPSAKKVGGLGTRDSTFRSPTSTPPMCAAISTRSRSASPMRRAADEIVFVLAMTTGARVHARVGGLAATDIKGEDGLR